MSTANFNLQPKLVGPALYLRPLHAEDFQGQYSAASNPTIWAGHPAKDRYKAEVFRAYFDAQLNSGAALAVIDRATDTIIGGSRYYVAPDQPRFCYCLEREAWLAKKSGAGTFT